MKTTIAHISDHDLEQEYIRRHCIKLGEQISGSDAAAQHFKTLFLGEQGREHMAAIFLNGNNRVISSEILFSGTLTTSAVYPREIIRQALEKSAAAIILGHNHPSGNLHPSNDDITITRRIKAALDTVDIVLHDHVIIGYGQSGYYSITDSSII